MSKKGLSSLKDVVVTLAEAEGLPIHESSRGTIQIVFDLETALFVRAALGLPTLQAGPRFHNLCVNLQDCLCDILKVCLRAIL